MIDYGVIRDSELYTLTRLKKVLRCKDIRTLRAWLKTHSIPVLKGPKGEHLVAGQDVRMAVQEDAQCLDEDPESVDAALQST